CKELRPTECPRIVHFAARFATRFRIFAFTRARTMRAFMMSRSASSTTFRVLSCWTAHASSSSRNTLSALISNPLRTRMGHCHVTQLLYFLHRCPEPDTAVEGERLARAAPLASYANHPATIRAFEVS